MTGLNYLYLDLLKLYAHAVSFNITYIYIRKKYNKYK